MNSSSTGEGQGSQAWFVTTHWSVVLAAQTKDSAACEQALEALCRSYWYPLYAYVRRMGKSPADAEDLTQGFFQRVLQKDYLKSAARERGRFRTFLLTALKAHLANEWDRQHAQKRGGFAQVVPLDQELAETKFALEGTHNLPPDVLFDRQWAMTLLEQTMAQLEQEYLASGRARLFESLRACVGKDELALSYVEIAAQLNLTEAAVKMAVHRLRLRYREVLQEQIAQTVCSREQVQDELRQLFSAFGG